ncbi:MAG: cytochrome c biogenesis heme-transporting ATPase CcmA [Gammaproteobacteria bacterium]|nr:cytochrome c biogenesis heme-transporting ATPase CcmA [Gammaproteobacteria bacterium]
MCELSVKNLHVFRGERYLLKGLEFEVPRGVCLQVAGANGAGKTTLLRVMSGLLEPEALELRWRGGRVSPRDPEYHATLFYLGHDPPLKDDFSAVENVAFNVGIRRSVSRSDVRAALERVGAQRFADLPVRTLSAGQRRRVALAALRLSGTNLWLLDEPVTNLDLAGQSLVVSLIEEHLVHGGLVVAAIHQDLGLSLSRRFSLNVGTGEGLP